jgi:hypothetical protein
MQTIDLDAPLIEPATERAIDDAMAKAQSMSSMRGHLGMSAIGGPCDRLLWLKFRWSLPDNPSPRILRVFKVGHMLEMAMVDWLRMVPGVELHTEDQKTGKQINFSLFGGHFGGSLDGVIKGIPEAPKAWHVWECKTANTKRFAELKKTGIKAWAPEYWSQAQCYMGSIGMDRALFTVINKDDSSIYTERLNYEPMAWDALQARAQRLLESDQPPDGTWKSPDHFESKMKLNADSAPIYFKKELPAPNCRNCRFSAPVLEGQWARWLCRKKAHLLSLPEQRNGCDQHEYITGLMPLTFTGEVQHGMAYKNTDGSTVVNGPVAGDDTFSSNELFHMGHTGFTPSLMSAPDLAVFRTEFGGRFVSGSLVEAP